MKTIDEYLAVLDFVRKERISLVVDYIRERYPDAFETLDFSDKIKFPTFKMGDVYVSVTSMKNYISIHFGKPNATLIVAENNPKIKAGVGCINIRDNIGFPIQDIKKAVDFCFEI